MKQLFLSILFTLIFPFIGLSQAFLEALEDEDINRMEQMVQINPSLVDSCFEVGNSNYTPLMLAIKFDNIAGLRFLLEAKANLEKTCGGKTALMYCAKYGRLEMAKVLVQEGAKLNAKYKGRTALDYAKRYEREQLADYLGTQ